jgi:myo-inositol 2-dehydrogenase / D-chiro-inositol 1-dehydrogenase
VFRWLCGEDIETVSAITKSSGEGSTVTVILTLTSRSGVLGVMELVREPGLHYDIGYNIVGSRGALRLAAAAPTDDWMQRFGQAYRSQDAAWLGAVAAEPVTGASAYDGYATNAVIDAALTSLVSGRTEQLRQAGDDVSA